MISVLKRVGIGIAVLIGVCALYTGYRELFLATGWTWPFEVDDITLPSLPSIVGALFDPVQEDGELLISLLFKAALFTAKEAVVGFAIGAIVGFTLGAVIARYQTLQRGLMPYVVGSQTIPILAIAPIVVVGLGSLSIAGWTPTDWLRVSVISAYLTFFPVTVNTRARPRVGRSARDRADALLRLGRVGDLPQAPAPVLAALPLRRLPDRGDGVRDRSDHRRVALVDPGRPRWRDHQLQPVLRLSIRRTSGRRT